MKSIFGSLENKKKTWSLHNGKYHNIDMLDLVYNLQEHLTCILILYVVGHCSLLCIFIYAYIFLPTSMYIIVFICSACCCSYTSISISLHWNSVCSQITCMRTHTRVELLDKYVSYRRLAEYITGCCFFWLIFAILFCYNCWQSPVVGLTVATWKMLTYRPTLT